MGSRAALTEMVLFVCGVRGGVVGRGFVVSAKGRLAGETKVRTER